MFRGEKIKMVTPPRLCRKGRAVKFGRLSHCYHGEKLHFNRREEKSLKSNISHNETLLDSNGVLKLYLFTSEPPGPACNKLIKFNHQKYKK